MTTTTNTTNTQATYYQVVFGPNEEDRQTYPDYGDGAFISRTAQTRAASFFLQLASAGRPCGFWVNGKLEAGDDLTGDPNLTVDPNEKTADEPEAAPAQHKTRTFRLTYERTLNMRTERYQEDPWSKAECTCGWSEYGEDRADARRRARGHRQAAGAVGARMASHHRIDAAA